MPDSRIPRIANRPLTILVLIPVLMTAQLSIAQNAKPGGNTSVLEALEKQQDEFFERMWGQSSPDEDLAHPDIKISVDEERQFGRPQVAAFCDSLKRQNVRYVRKGKDVEYLGKLVATIRPLMENAERYPNITIYLVESSQVDARAFPGGTLFFYRGLLTVAENEAALVGIVGHELSHLDRGHLLTPLKNSKRMEQTFAGEFVPHTFLASQRTMWKTFARPFRPEDESMADLDGATWAFRAGYDPREMARLFDTLHRNRLDPKLPWSEFFRTHPYSDDRCEAILKRYHDLQHDSPSDALYRGQTNLVRRIPRSQQQFPE